MVNRTGHAIFRRFTEPTSIDDVVHSGFARDEVDDVVRRLSAHDIVHPVGSAPTPEFAESHELTAWLHVTNDCNLRCPYCYVHKTADPMTHDVARDSVDALVRSAVRHGFRALRLKYAGGEASMNAGVVVELHDYALARCADAGLTLSAVLLSNGVAINDHLAGELKARDIRVMISLDGIGAAHDAQRPTVGGKPSSALVTRTVDRLIAAGVSPHISITITGRNVDAVAEVVRFALERELTFSFNFFRDNDCAATFTDLQYEEQAMVAGLRDAFAVVEQLLPKWSVLGSVLDRGQLLAPRQRSCGVGDDYVVIDQHGGIAKCHMEIGDTVGDVRTTDPVAAIRNDGVGIRNLLVEDKAGCRTCTWRHWCSGGCSVATFRATGRFDVRSPNCNIYRAVYPDAVRLEGLRLLRYATR
ncbi:MAG TPA: radical SAM protein [Pseudonocardiaceae bacterium]|nr:radical SAM protein [Pseudonocardiaceae bacterium]